MKDWQTGRILVSICEDDSPCWSHKHIENDFVFSRVFFEYVVDPEKRFGEAAWNMVKECAEKAQEK